MENINPRPAVIFSQPKQAAIDQKGAEAMFGTSWDKKYKIGTRTNTAGRRDLNVPPFDL